MAMLKIKTGDTVRVIAGKDAGKEGKVLSIDRKKSKVLVEGVNNITKHSKKQGTAQGEIIHSNAPIDISNVMYVYKGKPTRIGFKVENDKKVRFAKTTGDVID